MLDGRFHVQNLELEPALRRTEKASNEQGVLGLGASRADEAVDLHVFLVRSSRILGPSTAPTTLGPVLLVLIDTIGPQGLFLIPSAVAQT